MRKKLIIMFLMQNTKRSKDNCRGRKNWGSYNCHNMAGRVTDIKLGETKIILETELLMILKNSKK